MRLVHSRGGAHRREGKILAMFGLLGPVLVGMLGLVVDFGLMMSQFRQAQNAADAGAMAAAWDLLRGRSSSTATTTATTFVQNYNGLSGASVTVNIPPTSGNYQGNSAAAQVIVSVPMTTLFVQVLGVSSTQTVSAKAVAAYEPVTAGEGVGVLDPTAVPGLDSTSNNTYLKVNGRVTVNSTASAAPTGSVSVGHLGGVQATFLRTVGGISSTDQTYITDYTTGQQLSSLYTGQTPEPDPLINLPTPTTSNGVVLVYPNYNNSGTRLSDASSPQALTTTGNTNITLVPGIYSSISLNGGTATFQSGIYVIAGGGLTLKGATITGTGVMFYNTGKDYNPSTGAPDNTDVTNYNPVSSSVTVPTTNNSNFGGIGISPSSGATINLTPSTTSTDPFRGMLLYQRRGNNQAASVNGSSGTLNFNGTIYAQWAKFTVAGNGSYNAQFIVGSLKVTGGGSMTVNYSGQNLGKANEVFLVE
jgi:Flp pilus assembly protein TadG